MLKNIEGILELIDDEFGGMVERGKFRNRDDVDLVYTMMDIVKDACCLIEPENGKDVEYSNDGEIHSEDHDQMNDRDDWYSRNYGRSGGYTRVTRYSGNNGMGHGGRLYSYSRADARDEFIDNLHELMNIAPDDHYREGIRKMLNELEMER